MSVIEALYLELTERGLNPAWYDEDKRAFTIARHSCDEGCHIWIKYTWLYYWYTVQKPIPSPAASI